MEPRLKWNKNVSATKTFDSISDVVPCKTTMWASAQRDGRPAEYWWRPLFNAAKFGWCPLLECCAVTLPSRVTHWNLLGCPKLANRSQPFVGRSSPYCKGMCGRYCCLRSFFLLSIRVSVVKIWLDKVVRWCADGDFLRPVSPHGVALVRFTMHVWNVLHAACWKYRTQKIAILLPSHNFVGLYLHS